MIRIRLWPVLAGALVLLTAACGASVEENALATLQADTAFSAPVTVRIPKAIQVTAGLGSGSINGLGGVARYGPEHYHRLNPAMNALRAAGVLRLADRSRRVLVHTERGGFNICHPAPVYLTNCSRASETKIYDYSHTVQVIPTAVLGVEWRDDDGTSPAPAQSFALAGVDFTAGWVVDLGHRELVEIRQVRELDEQRMEVDYAWRWALTPTGRHFDSRGATVSSLASSQRSFAFPGVMDGLRADTVYTATATLRRGSDGWKADRLGLWH